MLNLKFTKQGLFATPKNNEDLQSRLENYNGSERLAAYTASGLTLNLAVDIFNEELSEITDLELPDDQRSCWVKVGNIAVYIVKNDEGVSVDMYTAGLEDRDEAHLAGCYAFFNEAEGVDDVEVPST